MVTHVDRQVVDEPLFVLTDAPGFSDQPIDVCSEHRARVIEGKQGIKEELLKLSLAVASASSTFGRLVGCVGMMAQ